jgi:type IV pilus assembly protein PilB
MEITQEKLHEMLVLPGHVTDEQFNFAVTEAQNKKVSLQEELIGQALISDKNLGRTIADYFDIHFIDLGETVTKYEYLSLIPEIVARAQRAVVFDVSEEKLSLATDTIDNYEFVRLLEKKIGKNISVFYATERGINTALRSYKGDLHDKINKLISVFDEDHKEGDVVRLMDLFLEYAYDNRASDIHIEPLENDVLIRFRVDGLLHEAVRYPKSLHDKIIFRIKIMAHMQTDEHAAAQDGRFEYHNTENDFDVRVSILPVSDGENVVMRLLDSHTHQYSLENLGLSSANYEKVLGAAKRPHGMILAVGPTGSGKTTVLYTILEKLNSPEVNVMTIEDPVEYDIEGVQQTQVNQKKNLTFANGLRSIVRQDPDIIMVGEIRDEETADIAINSALTGHLVISTLHTNDAATTFPRLTEMNVEPFLIASSVNIIIALRLVRKICPHCKESYILQPAELETLTKNARAMDCACLQAVIGEKDLTQLRLYRGKGCKACQDTGYIGRIGIYEVLEVDEAIRLLITRKEAADVIYRQALSAGMVPLLCDGIAKALDGTTTIEEVIKVAGT